jgi:hypothetical protein
VQAGLVRHSGVAIFSFIPIAIIIVLLLYQ